MTFKVSNLAKRFGPTIALDGVNFELKPGSVHALIGENGAGKSTLMGIISGEIAPDRGEMSLEGKTYRPDSPAKARENGIARIHQELSLFPHLTVTENILMGIESARFGIVDRRAARERAAKVLEGFSHPEIRPDKRLSDLPLPAWQVVEISRALACDARIVLMDEPTSSLGSGDVARLFQLIRHLRDSGISIVYISHFLEEVRDIADEFTVLRDGRSVTHGNIGDVSDEELISAMVGRSVESVFPARVPFRSNELMLRVNELHAPPALISASFELHKGEILGIAGLVGSGRTDMVRALFGLNSATSGDYELFGSGVAFVRSARVTSPSIQILEGVGYLSEDRKGEGLALDLSIADNLTLTNFSGLSRFGWLNRSKQKQRSTGLINQVGVKASSPLAAASTLSGGNQQKIVFGRLLNQGANVLLLDEPTRGIDIGSKVQIYNQIVQCAAEEKGVLLVSSYLPELFGLCDNIAVMSRGRLSRARPTTEWTPESVMQAAIGGA